LAATPAIGQDNAAAPADNAAMTADLNATAPPPPPAPAPVDQAAAPPADTSANQTAPAGDSDRGFPWGVLGLLGLIGLFGVRKVKG